MGEATKSKSGKKPHKVHKTLHSSTGTRGGSETPAHDGGTTATHDSKAEETKPLLEITGHEVQFGHTAPKQSVEQHSKDTLDPLLMKSGSVNDLFGENDTTWPALAKKLKASFQSAVDSNKSDSLAPLFTVYYSQENPLPQYAPLLGSQYLQGDEVPDTIDFLEKFMNKNGQWDYIKNQDWYTSGDYVVGIDVNYYANRLVDQEALPAFHKDTGGNNIFVNLIFDNEAPIEATEWFADLAQPSKTRRDWQSTLLPKSFRDALDDSRKSLQVKYSSDAEVNGGFSDGPYTYVSWVDDLVWHATPTAKARINFDAAAARTSYQQLNDEAMLDDNFAFHSNQFGRDIFGAEILGTMAESEGTELSKWLKKQQPPLTAQDIDVTTAKQAWTALYSGPKGMDTFVRDAETRKAYKDNWRITGITSEANAFDERLYPENYSIQETPRTLSTRRRANSAGQERKDSNETRMAEVRKDNETKTRSFLRTWIRILEKSDHDQPKIAHDTTEEAPATTEEVLDKTEDVSGATAHDQDMADKIDE
jgi:hypothetical protein